MVAPRAGIGFEAGARLLTPLRILASSSAVHMSPRLLSTANAPSAAAATAAAAAPVAPTDDSHESRCDPVSCLRSPTQSRCARRHLRRAVVSGER